MSEHDSPRTRRVVCGWCPTPLPDDMAEWDHHFLIHHGIDGHSVRFYANDDDPLEAWIDGSVQTRPVDNDHAK